MDVCPDDLAPASGPIPGASQSSPPPLPDEFAEEISRARAELLDLLLREFGSNELIHDAASSSVRTLLRRYHAGAWAPEVESPLVKELHKLAVARFRALRGQRHLPLLAEPVGPESARGQDRAEEEDWVAVQALLLAELKALRRKMAPYLEHTHHRAVFDRLIENEYRDKPLTRAQIAALCRCSESTVARVKLTFDRVWRPMVESKTIEIREVRSRLDS
jgi:hypothetical protein